MSTRSRALLIVTVVVAALMTLILTLGESGAVEESQPAQTSTLDASAPDEQEPTSIAASEALPGDTPEREAVPGASTIVTATDTPSARPVLRVRVVALEDRRPLAGVHVVVREVRRAQDSATVLSSQSFGELWRSRDQGVGLRTDDEGWVTVVARTGVELLAEAQAEFCGRSSATIAALAPGERRELELSAPTVDDRVLQGQVVSAETLRPIADAHVEVKSWGASPSVFLEHSCRTDSNGHFRLTAASWRRSSARVTAGGFAPARFRVADGHSSPHESLTVELQRAASLRVRVLDITGRAQVGAVVTVSAASDGSVVGTSDLDWGLRQPMTRSETTSRDGSCQFAGLPPAEALSLLVEIADHPPARPLETLSLAPGEERTVEVQISANAPMRGRLVDPDGAAVADADVWLLAATCQARRLLNEDDKFADAPPLVARTDAGGAFTFESVASGSWWIGPAPDRKSVQRLGAAAVAELVVVDPATPTPFIELRLERGLYIRGSVVRASSGLPVKAWVNARAQAERDSFLLAPTSDDGRFELGPLPAGVWTLDAASEDGLGFCAVERQAVAGAQDVVLELPLGGELHGRLRWNSSEPASEAQVWISRRGEDEATNRLADDQGEFGWTDVPAGVYDLFATTRGGQVGWRSGVTVTAGQRLDNVEIALAKGASVELIVDPPGGSWLVELWRGDAQLRFAVSDFGSTQVLFVPPGEVGLRLFSRQTLTKGEPMESRTVRLQIGEQRTVRFTTQR